ncbi:MAG TPA: EAL domain-containing protein [Burkholderiales bacterium]|nr:EAL domain-containing protein [Burkholderiales bacterium]
MLRRFRADILIILSGAAVIGAIWIYVFQALSTERENIVASATQSNTNLARAFKEELLRHLGQIDLLVSFAKRRIESNGVKRINLVEPFQIAANKNPSLIQLSFIDNKGWLAGSNLPYSKPVYLGDREHYKAHVNTGQDRLHIGRPVVGRVSGKSSVQISRRVNYPDGRLAGVLVASVDPAYFVKPYGGVDLGHGGSAAVVRSDGVILARQSGNEIQTGVDISASPLFAAIARSPKGNLIARSAIDGVQRFFSYVALDEYPLVTVTALSEDEVLRPYYQGRVRYFSYAAVASGFAAVMTVALLLLFVSQRRTADRLSKSEARFRSLMELSSDVYWEQDEHFRFNRFTDIMKRSFSVPVSERETFVGKARWELPNSRTSAAEWEAHKATLEAHKPFYDFVHSRVAADGKLHYISVSGLPIFDEEGTFKGYRGVTKDVTDRKAAEERIRHLAQHDELTGLPNRNVFNQNVMHAITRAQRYGRTLAILFIDLDRFKVINDTLGHEVGDYVLEEIAERLRGCMRGSDTIARFGGDEFVILIEEFTAPSDIAGVVNKLLGAVRKPLKNQEQEFSLSASVGISTYPDDGKDAQTLLKNADIAMYRAKDRGRNDFQFYSSEMNVHSVERLAMESSLRLALERGEFLLHYQPKVEINTGRMVGMEALIRWRHPRLGLVFPEQFIPLAEETGLIVPIGEWALRAACSQNRAWQQQGMRPLRIAVNLSARQFIHERLLEDVAEVLRQTGLDPEFLELELTESTVMQNPEKTVKTLNAFRAMGIHLAIDDFGTGYSSLAYIKQFPIDSLKVDQSFIEDIPGDENDVAITKAIIALAQSLKLKVVAEGVENAEQLSFLREHICDQMQGYYCSKPLPEHEFVEFLRTST